MSIFGAVGISASEERVYRALLAAPRATLSEVAAASELTRARAKRALGALEAEGLVGSMPGREPRFFPAPPDIAMEGLIHRRREQLELARTEAARLAQEFRATRSRVDPIDLVEVVTGEDALRQRFVQLQRSAEVEVVLIDRPPYAYPPGINPHELEALARGVRYRVIYDAEALEIPGQFEFLERHRDAGEEVRVLTDAPIKLAIADHRFGLVPVHNPAPVLQGAVLVHESSLLDALMSLFEMCWERASPLTGAVSAPGEEGDDQRLLSLLTAGLKDEAIARQMGIGVRTVRRRIAEVMHRSGARTRFQAGALAQRNTSGSNRPPA